MDKKRRDFPPFLASLKKDFYLAGGTVLILVYFTDIEFEPIFFKNDKAIDFEQIKIFLINSVKNLK